MDNSLLAVRGITHKYIVIAEVRKRFTGLEDKTVLDADTVFLQSISGR